MLIRLDNSRLVINAQEFPQNVVLMSLCYGEAPGEVSVSYFDPTNHSGRTAQKIEPTRRLAVANRMFVHEFVMPFRDLADPLGRRGATGGFHFVADSAFRHQGAEYGVRTLDFTMLFPVIGGGTIRFSIGGQEWELANPTFDPTADAPPINTSYGSEGRGDEYISGPPGIDNRRVPDDVLLNAYRRTHSGYTSDRAAEIERRRRARTADFDLREVRPGEEPPEEPVRMYSGPSTNATPPTPDRIPVPPGVIIESNDPVEQRRQARLAQARAAEDKNAELEANLIREQNQSAIVIGPTRTPKKPPRTRFEREED